MCVPLYCTPALAPIVCVFLYCVCVCPPALCGRKDRYCYSYCVPIVAQMGMSTLPLPPPCIVCCWTLLPVQLYLAHALCVYYCASPAAQPSLCAPFSFQLLCCLLRLIIIGIIGRLGAGFGLDPGREDDLLLLLFLLPCVLLCGGWC